MTSVVDSDTKRSVYHVLTPVAGVNRLKHRPHEASTHIRTCSSTIHITAYLKTYRQTQRQAGSRRGSRRAMRCTYAPSTSLEKKLQHYTSYQSIQGMLAQCDTGCIIKLRVLIS